MFRRVVCASCRFAASGGQISRYYGTSILLKRSNSTLAAEGQSFSEEWNSAKPYNEICGYEPWPLIGNAWLFLPVVGELKADLVYIQDKLYEKFGEICRLDKVPGRNNMVFLFNPDDIEKVYRNEGQLPLRPSLESLGYYRTVTRKEFFDGIGGAVTAQGKDWQTFRTKVNPIMMQPRATKQYVAPIDAVAEDFIKRIIKIRDEKQEVPATFDNELYKWALESIVYIALDTRMGCLKDELHPDSEPQQMINAVQVMFDTLHILEVKLSPWKTISTPAWRKFVKLSDFFSEICLKYINFAAERLKNLPADSDRELTVLEKLLARDSNPKTAMVMALDMFFAGIDTTAYSTAVALYYLAKNPDKQQKLYEEIATFLPDRSQPVTSQILNELKYLKACTKESMRMHPILTGNIRTSTKDMVLSGYRIPEGTDLVLTHFKLCKMDKYFAQADKYIPERWLKSAEDNPGAATHPFAFMPFGFGPRMCLGRRFAELEMETMLAKIIRNFQVEYNYGDIEVVNKLLYVPTSPLKFKFSDRK